MPAPSDRADALPAGAVTLTAAADNSNKSRIPNEINSVVVAAVTTDANDWIVLPANPARLQRVWGWSTPAHELRTPAGSNVKINNVDGDGTNEAAIPATTLWLATYIDATNGWVLQAWTELGAVVTAIVPD